MLKMYIESILKEKTFYSTVLLCYEVTFIMFSFYYIWTTTGIEMENTGLIDYIRQFHIKWQNNLKSGSTY